MEIQLLSNQQSVKKPGRTLVQLWTVFCLLFAISGLSHAQSGGGEVVVTGEVRDEKNENIPGASIVLQGTLKGTTTNAEGKFSLSVPRTGAVLVVSFLGYKRQEINVGNRTSLVIKMEQSADELKEIVVVGYGTQRKQTLTGAISNIVTEQIKTTTHTSLAQSLQGKIAGVQIRQNSGEPGSFSTNINIRGFGEPLYVVDGVARDGGYEFQKINPDDIESISVLKDASAAIFGIRAGNGVVIVTTKKGRRGKPQFSYNAVYGRQSPTDIPRMTSALEWAEMRNDAAKNLGENPVYTPGDLEKFRTGAPGYQSTDWYKEVMNRSAGQQQHFISASGGEGAATYFASFGYQQENGLLKSRDMGYQKYTFRTNIGIDLSKNLRADLILSGLLDERNQPGDNFFNIFKGTRIALATERPYANDNPNYPSLLSGGYNPVALANGDLTGYTEDVNKFFQSTVSLTYTVPFVPGLRIKGLVAYDSNNYRNKSLSKSYNLYTYDDATDKYTPHQQRNPSRIGNNFSDNNRVTFQGQLFYNTVIAKKHNVGATLVYEQQESKNRWAGLGREYAFYTNDQIDQAGLNNQTTSGSESEYASQSLVGRLNYDYKEKYLLEVAARYDGSYRYHPDLRWGLFPVVSGGWRISEEDFMKNVPLITTLKLRGSYGLVGADAGAPFQYVPGFSLTGGGGYEFTNGNYTTGAASPAIVNEKLTWFKSNIKDIGVDVGLWNNRIDLTFDVYQRDRKGLLARRNVSLPNTFGGTLPEENLNSDRVRGIEFSAGYNGQVRDFQYGISGNFNFARTMNRFVERGDFLNSMDRWRTGAANRWNDVVWAYQLEGQFQNQDEVIYAPIQNGDLGNTRELPGDFRYKDVDGNGMIDGNDAMPLFFGGDPKLYYGVALTASWKGFDLAALFQGSGKYSVRFREVYAEVFAFRGNTPAYFHDRWHLGEDGQWIPGTWPASRFNYNVGAMYAESSAWRKDASYMRFKSLQLGYTVKSDWFKKIGLQDVRLYANAHNIFTWADPFVKPFDPEKIEGLFGAGLTYPVTRSYNFGINVKF
ncbi:SusC/RagA family TonB-linked outer membrane protein [Larkinella insperata]|uniref:SusC/RagA family TonB-linked outer membrane protein n=1 Tax=Larkinella insperata TaxID=332158 RepID=A0ABW3Q5T8_9BACT|nr:TonB-dependent receptor [Larkinella insperata]